MLRLAVFVALATFGISRSAFAATLLGDEVTQSFVPGFGDQEVNPESAIVGAGDEFVLTFSLGRAINIDVGADFISLTYNGVSNASLGGSPSELTFTSLDFGAGIGGIALDEKDTGTGGFGGNTAEFTADSIVLTLTGVWSDSDNLTIRLREAVAAVPLPASLPLSVFALGGLYGLSRRKKA